MWTNLSYASKTTMAVAGRIALYTGRSDIEAVHVAIAALEVGGNAGAIAQAESSAESLSGVLNEYLEEHRDLRQDYPDLDLAESARKAVDAAHSLKRVERFVDRFRRLSSWRAISSDQLVLGCLRTDETSRELLGRAGLHEDAFLAALESLPAESRNTERKLNGILVFDPDDWLLRTPT